MRVRVKVTLEDDGHRYSQREQLMSDDSHDQVTGVPDDLRDELIGASAPAILNGRHETDERIRTQVHLFPTDRLLRHTHLQPVAQHRHRGVRC